MNLPFPLKLYAILAFLSALSALWRGMDFLMHHVAMSRIALELLWAAFQTVLGVGILCLKPAARIVALICCWFTFVLFILVLVFWCIRPQNISVVAFLAVMVATALNTYFYIIFRRPDIRAMFEFDSSRPF